MNHRVSNHYNLSIYWIIDHVWNTYIVIYLLFQSATAYCERVRVRVFCTASLTVSTFTYIMNISKTTHDLTIILESSSLGKMTHCYRLNQHKVVDISFTLASGSSATILTCCVRVTAAVITISIGLKQH